MRRETNLQPLKRWRGRPSPGDIFAMLLLSGEYLFGRVVLADLPAERAPMPTANLVYIYDARGDSKAKPPMDALTPDSLLIAPQFTNRLPWSEGYFENVAHHPLRPSDVLHRHCFRDDLRGGYRNEAGAIIDTPIEPCGEWGLTSYRMIDDLISDALGIPRAP